MRISYPYSPSTGRVHLSLLVIGISLAVLLLVVALLWSLITQLVRGVANVSEVPGPPIGVYIYNYTGRDIASCGLKLTPGGEHPLGDIPYASEAVYRPIHVRGFTSITLSFTYDGVHRHTRNAVVRGPEVGALTCILRDGGLECKAENWNPRGLNYGMSQDLNSFDQEHRFWSGVSAWDGVP